MHNFTSLKFVVFASNSHSPIKLRLVGLDIFLIPSFSAQRNRKLKRNISYFVSTNRDREKNKCGSKILQPKIEVNSPANAPADLPCGLGILGMR